MVLVLVLIGLGLVVSGLGLGLGLGLALCGLVNITEKYIQMPQDSPEFGSNVDGAHGV